MSYIPDTIKKMRASRLLSILMLLQTRGRVSASALAAELEVSTRTVLRDIDQLSAAGVPVWSDRGREGGFQLREGWSTQLTGLTEPEARALFLSGLPKAATELGLGCASTSARLKMLASLPVALREDAARVNARLHIDPVEWYRAASPPKHLQVVANAVWHQRILAIEYESWNGTRNRIVKPLGLVLKAGSWYMAALADKDKDARTYRLANILTLSVREGGFKYPKKFQLAAYWLASTQRFEAEIYTGTATVRVSQRGMKFLRELSAAVNEAALKSGVPEASGKHWTRVTIPIESIEHAAHQLLSIGAEVEVLAPLALRKRMQKLLLATAALYQA